MYVYPVLLWDGEGGGTIGWSNWEWDWVVTVDQMSCMGLVKRAHTFACCRSSIGGVEPRSIATFRVSVSLSTPRDRIVVE